MSYHLNTIRGYSFPAVSSAMQKAIRRGDAKLAGYWALELWASGFGQYVWRRLLTVSAEDCWGILTAETKALHDSYTEINQHVPKGKPKGRIFISKAVILLCMAKKSRDADHLQNFVYDQQAGLDAATLTDELEQAGQYIPIPDYAYDCHTPLATGSTSSPSTIGRRRRSCCRVSIEAAQRNGLMTRTPA
jgi:replication-associated recombination protein RarA